MDPHLDDLLLRRHLEVLLKLALELPHREITATGEVGDGDLAVEVLSHVAERRGEFSP